jgi:E3 ubiquitin-protein ligase HUWE1
MFYNIFSDIQRTFFAINAYFHFWLLLQKLILICCYIMMKYSFQADIRSISISHWGSDLGLQVLKGLSRLYMSLVWESTILLAFCSEDVWPPDCQFGKADLEKLTKDNKDKDTEDNTANCDNENIVGSPPQSETVGQLQRSSGEMGSNGVSAAMETLSTSENAASPMEVEESIVSSRSTSGTSTASESKVFSPSDNDEKSNSTQKKNKFSPALTAQIKQIKPLLSATSRLGRVLAELFGLLVKLSVGSPVRQRRLQQVTPAPAAPTPAARAVATMLGDLLAQGFSWTPPDYTPVPKLR